MFRHTNKQVQTRRAWGGFFPLKSANDLKISCGYLPENKHGCRLAFPPFHPRSPAFKIKVYPPSSPMFFRTSGIRPSKSYTEKQPGVLNSKL